MAIHELTEVMGRQLLTGSSSFGGGASYTPYDLFHYSSPGVRDFSASTPGYFSIDSGTTSLAAFNTNSGGDAGDWASSVTKDAFDAFSSPGVVNAVSSTDLTALDVIGWNQSSLCFAAGTNILTTNGAVPVEALAIGDLVRTFDGSVQPIKWIGRRSYDGLFIRGNHLMLPVRIVKDAIADGVPERDLVVSPGHGIYIDGALVPAWRLINGASITQAESVDTIRYFHIELDHYDILLAEGCPAESFHEDQASGNSRGQFENDFGFDALFEVCAADPGLPRVESGFLLDATRRRIAARAGVTLPDTAGGVLRGLVDQAGPPVVSGWAQDEDSPEAPVCLAVLADGKRIARVLANQYRADLRQAGRGTGCHAFEVALPEGVTGRIEVRRTADGSLLSLTEDAAHLAA